MSHRHSGYLVLAGALALALACGDDDTPTGGGGGGNNTLSIPPGTYQASGGFFDCDTHLPTSTSIDTLVWCSNEILDEFFGYDCPVRRSGNDLTLACTRTVEMSTGCNETVVIDIKGTVSGDHYELHGTLNYSDNPADCWDGTYCDSFAVSLDKIGDPPPACSYADPGTIALTVVGGAQAGKHTLDAFGGSDNQSGSIAFYFTGSSGTTAATAPREFSPSGISGIYLYGDTDYINPAILPQTLPAYIAPPDARAGTAAGGPEIALGYYENNGTQQFNATSVVSGGFVVEELDDDHIAGTLNVTLSGTQYDEAHPGGVAAQRTISGGYYVLGGTPVATTPGVLDRILAGLHRR